MCMERREEMTTEEILIEELKKNVEDLENTIITISRLLLKKKVYNEEEALEVYMDVMEEKESRSKSCNCKDCKINLEADIEVH